MSDELPEVTCPNCDMTFSVIFNRNPTCRLAAVCGVRATDQ